jgi:hypothetical protein
MIRSSHILKDRVKAIQTARSSMKIQSSNISTLDSRLNPKLSLHIRLFVGICPPYGYQFYVILSGFPPMMNRGLFACLTGSTVASDNNLFCFPPTIYRNDIRCCFTSADFASLFFNHFRINRHNYIVRSIFSNRS